MTMCLTLIEFQSNDIALLDGRVEVPCEVQSLIVTATNAGARILRQRKTIIPLTKTSYGDAYGLLLAAEPPTDILESHPLHQNSVSITSAKIRARYDAVVARHVFAHASGALVERPERDDENFLAFNAAVWALAQLGIVCVVFPEARTPWIVEPTDPATLRCVSKDGGEELALRGELVDGCYAIGPRLGDLIPNDDVLLSITLRLQHETVTQILCQMTVADAERIGIRRTTITARVRRKNGSVWEVVGEPIFSRR